ncbi:MAG: hypothetical protein NTU53_19350 [Planctomycetota bacterium]|nr:hypothetical protein [Planctomycetota bacterium]
MVLLSPIPPSHPNTPGRSNRPRELYSPFPAQYQDGAATLATDLTFLQSAYAKHYAP